MPNLAGVGVGLDSTIAPAHEKVNSVTSALEQGSAAIQSLRVTLRTAGYTQPAVEAAATTGGHVSTPELASVATYIETDREDPIASLTRLFHIGAPEARERIEKLLPDLDVDALVAAGVLAIADDGRVRSHLRIREVDGLLIAWDLDQSRDDWVVGVSASTLLAATHAPRVKARSAVDVGTGAGLHALLAARHCDHVVATDFNPRACWMTELNAQLNELANVETRTGSFFEPVAGERFDLVVVNPPYVISPEARYLYRDGGFEGDGLSRQLLADLPGLLEDGGFGVLQGNWIHGGDERWYAPIERGLEGSDCDALMARISTAGRLDYAVAWNEPHYVGDPDGYGNVVREWVGYWEEHGIEKVSSAMVVLRRRPGARHWRRAVSIARRPTDIHGDAYAALFEAQDRLAELDDDGLLDSRLLAPPELRVERYDQRAGKHSCVLDLERALGVRRPVPQALGELVLRLDGSSPLRDVEGGGDDLPGVRALAKLGFVTFA
jgi:Methyltransferase small domain